MRKTELLNRIDYLIEEVNNRNIKTLTELNVELVHLKWENKITLKNKLNFYLELLKDKSTQVVKTIFKVQKNNKNDL